jgi:hypothetical protein
MLPRDAALRRAQERLRERTQSGLRSKLSVPSVGSVFSGLLPQCDLPSVAEMSADRPREQALRPLRHDTQINLGYETLPFAPSAGGAKEGEHLLELNAREQENHQSTELKPLLNSSSQALTHMSSTQMPDKPSESTIPIFREPSTFSSSHAQSLQPALIPVAIYVQGAGLTAGIRWALPSS